MPLHDWTKVSPGTYHGFHSAWITEIARLLNNEVLPGAYYAESEQVAGETGPDVLTLEIDSDFAAGTSNDQAHCGGTVTLTQTRPQVTVTQQASEAELYGDRRRFIEKY